MNIYIDESGSINNHNYLTPYFVIALVHVTDGEKLIRAYKRFVSSNYSRLQELDADKINPKTGRVTKYGGRMFAKGSFRELKGVQFDREMKLRFVEFFSQKQYFDIYYIRIDNTKLTDIFCADTALTFNYAVRCAFECFIKNGLFLDENFYIQLDERNEKIEMKHFLENYLNAELMLGGITQGKFYASYYNSIGNKFIQIADVFSNLYYSELQTGQYTDVFSKLKKQGILKSIYDFSESCVKFL
ncbi:MAG: DUF3800 domain-containing protein [Lachnospiraceae bacterium]|mgnify:FL=1|jgi:hypothetical protein